MTTSMINLATLTPDQGFVIRSDSAGLLVGRGVASAGDVNGDGINDLIVGAVDASSQSGVAFVIYGTGAAICFWTL